LLHPAHYYPFLLPLAPYCSYLFTLAPYCSLLLLPAHSCSLLLPTSRSSLSYIRLQHPDASYVLLLHPTSSCSFFLPTLLLHRALYSSPRYLQLSPSPNFSLLLLLFLVHPTFPPSSLLHPSFPFFFIPSAPNCSLPCPSDPPAPFDSISDICTPSYSLLLSSIPSPPPSQSLLHHLILLPSPPSSPSRTPPPSQSVLHPLILLPSPSYSLIFPLPTPIPKQLSLMYRKKEVCPIIDSFSIYTCFKCLYAWSPSYPTLPVTHSI